MDGPCCLRLSAAQNFNCCWRLCKFIFRPFPVHANLYPARHLMVSYDLRNHRTRRATMQIMVYGKKQVRASAVWWWMVIECQSHWVKEEESGKKWHRISFIGDHVTTPWIYRDRFSQLHCSDSAQTITYLPPTTRMRALPLNSCTRPNLIN